MCHFIVALVALLVTGLLTVTDAVWPLISSFNFQTILLVCIVSSTADFVLYAIVLRLNFSYLHKRCEPTNSRQPDFKPRVIDTFSTQLVIFLRALNPRLGELPRPSPRRALEISCSLYLGFYIVSLVLRYVVARMAGPFHALHNACTSSTLILITMITLVVTYPLYRSFAVVLGTGWIALRTTLSFDWEREWDKDNFVEFVEPRPYSIATQAAPKSKPVLSAQRLGSTLYAPRQPTTPAIRGATDKSPTSTLINGFRSRDTKPVTLTSQIKGSIATKTNHQPGKGKNAAIYFENSTTSQKIAALSRPSHRFHTQTLSVFSPTRQSVLSPRVQIYDEHEIISTTSPNAYGSEAAIPAFSDSGVRDLDIAIASVRLHTNDALTCTTNVLRSDIQSLAGSPGSEDLLPELVHDESDSDDSTCSFPSSDGSTIPDMVEAPLPPSPISRTPNHFLTRTHRTQSKHSPMYAPKAVIGARFATKEQRLAALLRRSQWKYKNTATRRANRKHTQPVDPSNPHSTQSSISLPVESASPSPVHSSLDITPQALPSIGGDSPKPSPTVLPSHKPSAQPKGVLVTHKSTRLRAKKSVRFGENQVWILPPVQPTQSHMFQSALPPSSFKSPTSNQIPRPPPKTSINQSVLSTPSVNRIPTLAPRKPSELVNMINKTSSGRITRPRQPRADPMFRLVDDIQTVMKRGQTIPPHTYYQLKDHRGTSLRRTGSKGIKL